MDDHLEYAQEMDEFDKMHEEIRDIDYYKAQTVAAQNGQDAAMKFAAGHKADAAAWRQKYEDVVDQFAQWKLGTEILVWILIGVMLGLSVLSFLIGRWTG